MPTPTLDMSPVEFEIAMGEIARDNINRQHRPGWFKRTLAIAFLFVLPFATGFMLGALLGNADPTNILWFALAGGVVSVLFQLLTWLPAIIACRRRHDSRMAIIMVNLIVLFCIPIAVFTIVGAVLLLLWPVALVWALTGPRRN